MLSRGRAARGAEWPQGGLARGGLRSFGASDLGHIPRLGVTGSFSHHSAFQRRLLVVVGSVRD